MTRIQIAFLLCLNLAAAASAAIPDRVNVEKFKTLHSEKLEDSVEARRAANAKASTHRQRVSEREALENQRNGKSNQRAILQQSLTSLSESNVKLNTSIQEQQSTIQKNEKRRDFLSVEADRLQTAIEKAQTEKSAQSSVLDSASKATTSLQGELNLAEGQVSSARQQISQAQNIINSTQQTLYNKDQEKKRLEAELRRLQNIESGYEAQISAHRQRQTQLFQLIPATKKEHDELVVELAASKDKKEQVEERIEKVKREITNENDKIAALTQRLADIQKNIQGFTGVLKSMHIDLHEKKHALADVDLEKQRLEEILPLLEQEISHLQKEETQINQNLLNAREQLAKADDAAKPAIQKEIDALLKQHDNNDKALIAKNKEYKASRKTILEIPDQKKALRHEVLELEEDIVAKEGALTQAQTNSDKLGETKKEHTQNLAEANRRLSRLEANLKETLQDWQRVQKSLVDTRERQQKLQQENSSIRQSIETLTAQIASTDKSIRDLGTETLPALLSEISDWEKKQQGAQAEKTQLEQALNLATSVVNEKKRALGLAQQELAREQQKYNDIHQTLRSLENQKSQALSESAQLATSNSTLLQTITRQERQIQSQLTRMAQTQTDITSLDGEIDQLQKSVDSALEVESIALGAFQLANTAASRLEDDTQQAHEQYRTVVASYESEKTAAAAAGVVAANNHGQREGQERGSVAAIAKQGTDAGSEAGELEGSTVGKKRDYEKAYEVAYDQLLVKTKKDKSLESPQQKALRDQTPVLQTTFSKGLKQGTSDGNTQGLSDGDNAEKEKEGYEIGLQLGSRRAKDEAERTHRPLGRQEAEAEILGSPAKTKEVRDAQTEDVSPQVGMVHGVLERLLGFATLAWNQLIPSVNADSNLGVITDKDVPAVKFTYREYKDDYPHPDFNDAYARAYDSAYVTSYVETYKETHRLTFVQAYQAAFALAKQSALDKTYSGEITRGNADGSLQGTFEGLGYNGGYEQGYANGKLKGENTALNRGKAAGEPKGYGDTIVQARIDSKEAGRNDILSHYRNSVQVRWIDGSEKLNDEDGNGKFQIGEKVSISGTLRNFGGVAASKGTLVLEVKSHKGIALQSETVTLGEVGGETEVLFNNLFVGSVQAGSNVSLSADILLEGKKIGSFSLNEDIYAPYSVAFRYYYAADEPLRVGSVGDGSGYHNAVWVQSLGDADLLKGLEISVTPTDDRLTRISWSGGGGDWHRLDAQKGNWSRAAFFLYALRRPGLSENTFRVKLKDNRGNIVFDQEVKAPVEVKR